MEKIGSLTEHNPELANEWHPTKNKLTPYDYAPGSGRKVWWICSRGHEWKASVGSRSRGTGCPKCNIQTSKLEIRIFTELSLIFEDVRWQPKIDDQEIDVYIPGLKIGVELDGYPWHEGNEERDLRKEDLLKKQGIDIIRVRDNRLEKIHSSDILYKDGQRHYPIIKQILKRILEIRGFSDSKLEVITQYISGNQLRNRKEFRRIVSLLPGPIHGKSLEALHPDVSIQWHPTKNHPLQPSMFTPGSDVKV